MKKTIYSPGELVNLKAVYKHPHPWMKNTHVVHVYFNDMRISPGIELVVDTSVLEKIKLSDKKNSKSKFNHPQLLEKFKQLKKLYAEEQEIQNSGLY